MLGEIIVAQELAKRLECVRFSAAFGCLNSPGCPGLFQNLHLPGLQKQAARYDARCH
jgi:hypothetical protein